MAEVGSRPKFLVCHRSLRDQDPKFINVEKLRAVCVYVCVSVFVCVCVLTCPIVFLSVSVCLFVCSSVSPCCLWICPGSLSFGSTSHRVICFEYCGSILTCTLYS